MTGDGPTGRDTLRDAFRVWDVNRANQEAVLVSSDDQHYAVPLPDEHADLLEALAESGGTLDATLVPSDGPTSWAV
ncbi:hypothetical protein, partial [Halorussus sp. GCM10023401]